MLAMVFGRHYTARYLGTHALEENFASMESATNILTLLDELSFVNAKAKSELKGRNFSMHASQPYILNCSHI
jgi:hypothetical protein